MNEFKDFIYTVLLSTIFYSILLLSLHLTFFEYSFNTCCRTVFISSLMSFVVLVLKR